MPPAAAARMKSSPARIKILPSGSSLGGGDGMGLAIFPADGSGVLPLRGDGLFFRGGGVAGAACPLSGGGGFIAAVVVRGVGMGVGVASGVVVLSVTLGLGSTSGVEGVWVVALGVVALSCVSGGFLELDSFNFLGLGSPDSSLIR